MQCASDPSVETELRCGKCETPICPRCLVQTPVGARCRACANLRKPVLYTVTPLIVVRASAAAACVAVGVGILWWYLLPNLVRQLGFFSFFAAAGYGWLVAEAIGRATARHRGTEMRVIAVISCVLVFLVHNALVPPHTLLPQGDIYGFAFVVIASIVGAGYLR